MNTNQLKIFATKARKILRRGVLNKLHWLGFDDEGRPIEKERPRVYQGGTAWRNAVYPESFGQQWLALAARIERRGLREVVEEGAYTWFNRLMAIHILAKNNLCEPILDYSETGLPMLVEDARVGRIPGRLSAEHNLRNLLRTVLNSMRNLPFLYLNGADRTLSSMLASALLMIMWNCSCPWTSPLLQGSSIFLTPLST